MVIFGDIPQEKLVNTLLAYEDDYFRDPDFTANSCSSSSSSSSPPSSPRRLPLQPFSTPCERPQIPVQALVEFPSVDEEFGMAEISWRVEDSLQNRYQYLALSYLLDMLTEKIISPFAKGR